MNRAVVAGVLLWMTMILAMAAPVQAQVLFDPAERVEGRVVITDHIAGSFSEQNVTFRINGLEQTLIETVRAPGEHLFTSHTRVQIDSTETQRWPCQPYNNNTMTIRDDVTGSRTIVGDRSGESGLESIWPESPTNVVISVVKPNYFGSFTRTLTDCDGEVGSGSSLWASTSETFRNLVLQQDPDDSRRFLARIVNHPATGRDGVVRTVTIEAEFRAGLWCRPDDVITDVVLPYFEVSKKFDVKPYSLIFGELLVDFTVRQPAGTMCEAASSRGGLPVYLRPVGLEAQRIGTSVATATLTIYAPGAAPLFLPCDFTGEEGAAVTRDCNLSGIGSGFIAVWRTPGFTSRAVYKDMEIPVPGPLGDSGPLSFAVNLSSIGFTPLDASMETIVRVTEAYIHTTLIPHLPEIASYTVVQDPGHVRLALVTQQGQVSGSLPDGRVVLDIPGSAIYDSPTNPAVVLFGTREGAYQVLLTGTSSGPFQLAASTLHPNEETPQAVREGLISTAERIGFSLTLQTAPDGTVPTLQYSRVIVGDLNGDSAMSCADVQIVRNAFGTRLGSSSRFNAWSDINADSVVDVRDLAMVTRQLPAGTVCR